MRYTLKQLLKLQETSPLYYVKQNGDNPEYDIITVRLVNQGAVVEIIGVNTDFYAIEKDVEVEDKIYATFGDALNRVYYMYGRDAYKIMGYDITKDGKDLEI